MLLHFAGPSRLPLIRQNEIAECGFACLAMVAAFHGYSTDIASLRRKHPGSLRGMTLKTLIKLAASLELSARPVQVPLDAIHLLRLPAIIHWDMNHFVVLRSVTAGTFVLHDPAAGIRVCPAPVFSRHFTGIALELYPGDRFSKGDNQTHLHLSDLWKRVHGLGGNLLQTLILSVLLQAFVLLSPLYLQLAVDEALSTFDTDLLLILALGFGGLTLISVTTRTLRAFVMLHFGSMLSYQVMRNLFRHLVRLPMDYFEKRHIGDIVARFSSIQPVREMITEGFVSGLIDGVMALTTLVMMYFYSPLLGSIALAAWFFYLFIRLLFYRPYRRAQEDRITSQARENSMFMETIRGITSIKLLAGESEREIAWQGRLADYINASIRADRLDIGFDGASRMIFGMEHVVLVYYAVDMAMGGGFSTGMIFAFMAFRQHFSGSASDLVERLIAWRMIALHLERIADIALSEPEDYGAAATETDAGVPAAGNLRLRNVHFRYSPDSDEILAGVNLDIEAGSLVAITGVSGCGKTTLLRIMSSLLMPTSGQVMVDAMPLPAYGIARYRGEIGVVLQEDTLFAGSIAENIAFFSADIDMRRVVLAARQAGIDDEIRALPMHYESLIGDMGSALSVGQKQRILLARALYRRPTLLFMDEATAHLDTATERRVHASLAGLGITRVMSAHRPASIATAGRVLLLERGRLKEIGVSR